MEVTGKADEKRVKRGKQIQAGREGVRQEVVQGGMYWPSGSLQVPSHTPSRHAQTTPSGSFPRIRPKPRAHGGGPECTIPSYSISLKHIRQSHG